jgi:hypothetical protein
VKYALAVILAASAACSWNSDVKKDVVAEEKIVLAAEKETTKTQEETKVETKTIHEESAVIIVDADGSLEITRVPAKGPPVKLPKGAKIQGTVPLNTTTMQQDKIIGAKAEDTKDKINVHVDDKIVDKGETKKSTGMSLQFYAIVISIVVILLIAAYLYFRPRT